MPKTYTVKQVADALNFSTNTVYKYLEEGRIKAVRLGTTGRFKVPESELARLLGELPKPGTPEPQPETAPTPFLSTPHHLHLFDWFLAITSILLGLVYFIYPLQNLASLDVTKYGLIFAGIYLIACDLITPQKNRLLYSLRTLPLSAVYLFLTYNFFASKDYFNLSISFIIFTFSLFPGKISDSVSRFILFSSSIICIPTIITFIMPGSPLLSPEFQSLTNANPLPFITLVIFITLAYLASSLLLLKLKNSWAFIPFSVVGISCLVMSSLFLSRIHWTPTIVLLTTGTFSFLFPFAARIENQLPLTKKQYLITFLWFMVVISIGTGLVYLNQIAFEQRELSAQTEKVSSASQLITTFLETSGKFTSSFSENFQLITLLSSAHSDQTSLNQLTKTNFLNSTSFGRLLVTDSLGKIISVYPPFATLQTNQNISARNYFQQAKSSNLPIISESTIPIGQDSPVAITVTSPIYKNGQFLGVVVGSLDLDKLNSRLSNVSSLDNSSFLLVDQKNTIFVSGKNYLLGQPLPLNSYIMLGTNHQLVTNSISEQTLSFTAYTQIPSTKWTLAIETPYATSAARNSYLSFAILLTTLFLGSGTLTASWYLKSSE